MNSGIYSSKYSENIFWNPRCFTRFLNRNDCVYLEDFVV